MWLSYRCFISKGEESIPIFGPFGVAAQIGTVAYTRLVDFGNALSSGWTGSR